MLRFRQFISEGVDKLEFPHGHVRVYENPSAEQVNGLLNLANRRGGYGAGSGSVRYFTNGDNLHVWHDNQTIHHDVHKKMFGTSEKEYSTLEKNDENFVSGSFLRPVDDEPFHIGIRQSRGREVIPNHPAFEHLRDHEGKLRKIEKFDT